ncbi:MAG: tRNA (adenosine(37)-N6)-threonylcarbamoyltransferase complex transferase subunit TsaD [Gemmatimonadales bacterium]
MIDAVLGIETSCDETSAAVLVARDGRPTVASLVILSQDVHAIFGGVVPELASRAHVTAIGPVVRRALDEARLDLGALDAVAVTTGPGLIGSLLVGVCYGKALAVSHRKALIGVHHLEGHLFAPTLEHSDLEPPFVALVVSGGHTLLLDVPAWGRYHLLGETRDDAAGEAFDKVASMLDLGYPGGPEIERLAAAGDPSRYDFPRPMLGDGLDFSFSGLKTAVLHRVRAITDLAAARANLAASFQAAVLDVLVTKTAAAVDCTGRRRVVLGGGVACSRALAQRMRARLGEATEVVVASPRLNADNAAMIARAGWFHLMRGERSDPDLDAEARLPFPGLERPPSPALTSV